MPMIRKVVANGNSLLLSVTEPLNAINVVKGDRVEITVENNALIIRKKIGPSPFASGKGTTLTTQPKEANV